MRRRRWLLAGLVCLAGLLAAVIVPHVLDKRSDDQAYDRMLGDPSVALVPPESEVVEQSSDGPCEGDSLTGPAVVTALSSNLDQASVLEFYRSELERLGWSDVSTEDDSVTAHRDDEGYELEFEAYADSFEDIDFWAVLRTEPRQNCVFPLP